MRINKIKEGMWIKTSHGINTKYFYVLEIKKNGLDSYYDLVYFKGQKKLKKTCFSFCYPGPYKVCDRKDEPILKKLRERLFAYLL